MYACVCFGALSRGVSFGGFDAMFSSLHNHQLRDVCGCECVCVRERESDRERVCVCVCLLRRVIKGLVIMSGDLDEREREHECVLRRTIKGLVVMSQDLDDMLSSLRNHQVCYVFVCESKREREGVCTCVCVLRHAIKWRVAHV